MKIQLTSIVESFSLKDDTTGKSKIAVRQARTGDAIHMGDLFSLQRRVWNDAEVGIVKTESEWNFELLKRERAYLTVVRLDIEDEDGKPIFKFKTNKNGEATLAMGTVEFYDAWDKLTVTLTDEIHEHILAVNPQWDLNADTEGE